MTDCSRGALEMYSIVPCIVVAVVILGLLVGLASQVMKILGNTMKGDDLPIFFEVLKKKNKIFSI